MFAKKPKSCKDCLILYNYTEMVTIIIDYLQGFPKVIKGILSFTIKRESCKKALVFYNIL